MTFFYYVIEDKELGIFTQKDMCLSDDDAVKSLSSNLILLVLCHWPKLKVLTDKEATCRPYTAYSSKGWFFFVQKEDMLCHRLFEADRRKAFGTSSVVWEANAISCFKILPSDVGKAKDLLCRHSANSCWRLEAGGLLATW